MHNMLDQRRQRDKGDGSNEADPYVKIPNALVEADKLMDKAE